MRSFFLDRSIATCSLPACPDDPVKRNEPYLAPETSGPSRLVFLLAPPLGRIIRPVGSAAWRGRLQRRNRRKQRNRNGVTERLEAAECLPLFHDPECDGAYRSRFEKRPLKQIRAWPLWGNA